MGQINTLAGKRVYLDTNCIVYIAEYEPDSVAAELKTAVERSHEIMLAIDDGKIIGATGEITLAEVLVGALRDNRQRMAAYYRQFLSDEGGLHMLPVSRDVWELSAELRADFLSQSQKLLMPDAIQLATAINGGCEVFVCNDRKLANKAVATGKIQGFYLGKESIAKDET